MAKDRLAVLFAAQSHGVGSDDIAVTFEEIGIMDDFFIEVHKIIKMIDKIQANVDQLKKKHSTNLSTPQSDESIKQVLDDSLNTDIKKLASKVRTKFKGIEKTIKQEERANKTSANVRIRKTQHSTLSRKFVEVMIEYNEIQVNYRERCKVRLQRHLEILGKTTTNEEFEEMLEQGNSAVFTQCIIQDKAEAKQILADIEARHSDIIKLENSIRKLHEMFMDMKLLVEGQGDMIDHIEYNVKQADDYVKSGAEDIRISLNYMRKARRKKICLGISLVVIVLVLLAAIILF